MKRLEVIELRSLNYDKNKLENLLLEIVTEFNQKSPLIHIKLYSHIALDTDFSIHILHEKDQTFKDENSIGIQIFLMLKNFGLVNHSTWVEKYTIGKDFKC